MEEIATEKEYCFDKSILTKWHPIIGHFFSSIAIYKVWKYGFPFSSPAFDLFVIFVLPSLMWIWFFFFTSYWPEKFLLKRSGFETYDLFNRKRFYGWNDIKYVENNIEGATFIFKNRMYGKKHLMTYYFLHRLGVQRLVNYDDFINTIGIFAPFLEWKETRVKWF